MTAINNSSIDGTSESAYYMYDLAGRLVTSSQGSNGSSAQRKFEYDRWGNRTTVWPSVFGGTAIQTVTLVQSGGAPTNQIASVTNSGITVNYTYDAAGNVTNDGVHSYTYDAENRVVGVDGGSTVQYKYDNQNRRVSKIIGSNWTHYVWQGSQVIGEHDATTAYTTNPTYQVNSVRLDYIHLGSRRIYSRQRASSGGVWTSQYYLSDRLSTRLVLDASGKIAGRMAHLPFGEDFASSGTQEKHHLTSYERDGELATDYAINRQHDPSIGRFNRVDPASGSVRKPQSLNRYVYVTNDAINSTDPAGLAAYCPPGCMDPETGECNCGSTSGEPPSFDPWEFDFFTVWLDTAQNPGGGATRRAMYVSDSIDRFFHDQQDCEQAINSALDNKFGGVLGDFQTVLSRTHFEDYLDHANQTLDELKLGRAGEGSDAWDIYTTKLKDVLGPGGSATALTSITEHTVYLGAGFLASSDFSLRGQVLVHETLHSAFGNHVAIAKALGIQDTNGHEFGAGEENAARDAIQAWMMNDCHQ